MNASSLSSFARWTADAIVFMRIMTLAFR